MSHSRAENNKLNISKKRYIRLIYNGNGTANSSPEKLCPNTYKKPINLAI